MTRVTFNHHLIALDAAGMREFTGLVSRALGSGWNIDALGQRLAFGSKHDGERLGLRPGVCLARALAGDDRRYHATTEHLRALREVVRTNEQPPAERRITPDEYLAGKSTVTATNEQPMSKPKKGPRTPSVRSDDERMESLVLIEQLREAKWSNGQLAYVMGYPNDSVVPDIIALRRHVHSSALDALRVATYRAHKPPQVRYDRQVKNWVPTDPRTERRIAQEADVARAMDRAGVSRPRDLPPEDRPAKVRDSIPAEVVRAPAPASLPFAQPSVTQVHEPRVMLRCQATHDAHGQCTLDKDHDGRHQARNLAEWPWTDAKPSQDAKPAPTTGGRPTGNSVIDFVQRARQHYEEAYGLAQQAQRELERAASCLGSAAEKSQPLWRAGLAEAQGTAESHRKGIDALAAEVAAMVRTLTL